MGAEKTLRPLLLPTGQALTSAAMSKSAVKISLDLLSNPLCEQDQDFLSMVTALDTAMKRMDAFNQEKVTRALAFLASVSEWVEQHTGPK